MDGSLDMTSVINTFTANGHQWIAVAFVVLTALIIPLFKHWVKRENEIQKELAEARKKERDSQMNEMKSGIKADLEQLRGKIAQHDKQFESGNIRFGRIETELKDISREIGKISGDIGKIGVTVDFIKERLK